jgi:hypothetical protein
VSVSLASLVSDLQADVPARDSVPSADQYERCVKRAVADYGARRPTKRVTTLSIVNGTATYDLPDDFHDLVKLESLTHRDGIINSGDGLIPVSSTYTEEYSITGRQITFWPTPSYSLSRDMWYLATHVLDDSDEYPYLLDEDAEIILLLAQAKALRLQANAVAGDAWKYDFGDERVDKTGQPESLRKQAKLLEQEYQEALSGAIGTKAIRADYNAAGR